MAQVDPAITTYKQFYEAAGFNVEHIFGVNNEYILTVLNSVKADGAETYTSNAYTIFSSDVASIAVAMESIPATDDSEDEDTSSSIALIINKDKASGIVTSDWEVTTDLITKKEGQGDDASGAGLNQDYIQSLILGPNIKSNFSLKYTIPAEERETETTGTSALATGLKYLTLGTIGNTVDLTGAANLITVELLGGTENTLTTGAAGATIYVDAGKADITTGNAAEEEGEGGGTEGLTGDETSTDTVNLYNASTATITLTGDTDDTVNLYSASNATITLTGTAGEDTINLYSASTATIKLNGETQTSEEDSSSTGGSVVNVYTSGNVTVQAKAGNVGDDTLNIVNGNGDIASNAGGTVTFNAGNGNNAVNVDYQLGDYVDVPTPNLDLTVTTGTGDDSFFFNIGANTLADATAQPTVNATLTGGDGANELTVQSVYNVKGDDPDINITYTGGAAEDTVNIGANGTFVITLGDAKDESANTVNISQALTTSASSDSKVEANTTSAGTLDATIYGGAGSDTVTIGGLTLKAFNPEPNVSADSVATDGATTNAYVEDNSTPGYEAATGDIDFATYAGTATITFDGGAGIDVFQTTAASEDTSAEEYADGDSTPAPNANWTFKYSAGKLNLVAISANAATPLKGSYTVTLSNVELVEYVGFTLETNDAIPEGKTVGEDYTVITQNAAQSLYARFGTVIGADDSDGESSPATLIWDNIKDISPEEGQSLDDLLTEWTGTGGTFATQWNAMAASTITDSAFVESLFKKVLDISDETDVPATAEIAGFTQAQYLQLLSDKTNPMTRLQIAHLIASSSDVGNILLDAKTFVDGAVYDLEAPSAERIGQVPTSQAQADFQTYAVNHNYNLSFIDTVTNALSASVDALVAHVAVGSGYDISTDLNEGKLVKLAYVSGELTEAPNVEILVMSTNSNINATFAADSLTEQVAIGGLGGSNVTFESSASISVQMMGGDEDSVTTGAGNDYVYFSGGNDAAISTGAGNDTIVLANLTENAVTGLTVDAGAGDDIVSISTFSGYTVDAKGNTIVDNSGTIDISAATISGGDGLDTIQLDGYRTAYVYTADAEQLTIKNSTSSDVSLNVTFDGFEFVRYNVSGQNTSNLLSQISIISESADNTLVSNMFYAAFGKGEGPEQLSAIKSMLDFEGDAAAKVQNFVSQDAYINGLGSITEDTDFVQQIFNNLTYYGDKTIELVDGNDVAYYAEQIAAIGRDNVLWEIAASETAQFYLNNAPDKGNYVVDMTGEGPTQYVAPPSAIVTVPADEADIDAYLAANTPDVDNVQIIIEGPREEASMIHNIKENVVAVTVDEGANASVEAELAQTAFTLTGSTGSELTFTKDDSTATLINTTDATVTTANGANTVNVSDSSIIAVTTGTGDDTVTVTDTTDATVDTGEGNDTVSLNNDENVIVNTGAGDDTVNVAGLNSGSIDGGDDFDTVNVADVRSNYKLTVDDTTGQVTLSSVTAARAITSTDLLLDGVELVTYQPAAGATLGLGDVSIIAADANQDLLAKLLYVANGEGSIDNLTDVIKASMALTADDTATLVAEFLAQPEIAAIFADMSSQEYVDALFANLNAYSADTLTEIGGYTANDYVEMLEDGTDRSIVAWNIAASAEAQDALGESFVIAMDGQPTQPDIEQTKLVVPADTPDIDAYIAEHLQAGAQEVKLVVETPNSDIINDVPTAITSVEIMGNTAIQADNLEQTNFTLTGGTSGSKLTFTNQDGVSLNVDGANGSTFNTTAGNDIVDLQNVANIVLNTNTGNDEVVVSGDEIEVNAGDGDNSVTATGAKIGITTGSGNDTVEVADAASNNIQINAGDGANNVTATGKDIQITTGSGNDTVTLNEVTGANSKVDTGDGDDTVSMTGSNTATINMDGDIDGGFDTVLASGSRSQYAFAVNNGALKLSVTAPMGTISPENGTNVTVSGAELVMFNNNEDLLPGLQNIAILASDGNADLVGKLFYVAYGDEAIADLKDTIQAQMTAEYEDTAALVSGFMAQDALVSKYGALDNTDFVNTLFANLNAYSSEETYTKIGGYTSQNYIDLLANGSITRDMIIWNIAASDEAQTVLGATNYVIAMNEAAATPDKPAMPQAPADILVVPADTNENIDTYIEDNIPADVTNVEVQVEQPNTSPITSLPEVVSSVVVEQGTPVQADLAQTNFSLTGSDGSRLNFTAETDVTVAVSEAANVGVTTTTGNDNVTMSAINVGTVDTGAGADTIELEATQDVVVNAGEGDDTVILTGKNTATLNMDAGFDTVDAVGTKKDYNFSVANNQLTLSVEAGTTADAAGTSLILDNVELVQFNTVDGTMAGLKDISIVASDNIQDLLGKLFYVAYGTNTIDNMQTAIQTQMTADYADATAAVAGFMAQDALVAMYDGIEDTPYVEALFQNLNAYNDGEILNNIGGYDVQGYVELLAAGTIDRDTVAWNIAASAEAQDVLGTANFVVALNDEAATPEQPVIPEPTPTEPVVTVPADTADIDAYIAANLPDGATEVKVVVEAPQEQDAEITQLPAAVNDVEVQGDTPLNLTDMTQADFTLTGSTGSSLGFSADAAHTVNVNDASDVAVATGEKDDSVSLTTVATGNVNTGAGNDAVNLNNAENVTINTGAGNDTVNVSGLNSGEINAGEGFDTINVAGARSGYTLTVGDNDQVTLASAAVTRALDSTNLLLSGAELITYEPAAGAEAGLGDVSILASNNVQDLLGKLFYVAYGAEAITDMQTAIQNQMTADYADAETAVTDFMAQEALASRYEAMDDTAYVNALFANLNAYNSGEALTEIGGYTAQGYVDLLADGSIDRDTVVWNIAASAEAQNVLGNYVVALNDAAATPEQPVIPEPTPTEPVIIVPANTADIDAYIAAHLPLGAQEWKVIVETPQAQGTIISELPAAINDVEVLSDTAIQASLAQTDFTLTGSNGSNIAFTSQEAVTVTLNQASAAQITTGKGADTVTANNCQGNSILAGDGNDTVTLNNSAINVTAGDGDDNLILLGDCSSVADMGEGFDTVATSGAKSQYTMQGIQDMLFLTTEGMETPSLVIQGGELLTFDYSADVAPSLGNSAILATDTTQDLLGKLFYVAYGQDDITDMKDVIKGQMTAGYATATSAVAGFMTQEALVTKYEAMDDTAYVNALFANLNAYNSGESLTEIGGYTAQEYADLLAAGSIDRDTVIWNIAASADAQTVLGGANYVVALNDTAATPEQPVMPEPTPVEPVITVPANTADIDAYITEHLPAGATEVKVIVETPQAANSAITELASAINNVEVLSDTAIKASLAQTDFTLTGSIGSNITFTAQDAVTLALNQVDTATIATGDGADNVTLNNSQNIALNTGDGADSVTVNDSYNGINVNTGDGADSVTINSTYAIAIDTGTGDDSVFVTGHTYGTITMGAGFDTVAAAGAKSQYVFTTYGDDQLHLSVETPVGTMPSPEAGTSLQLSGVELVTFDNGANLVPNLGSSAILASDATQDLLGKLFYVAYGQDVITDMKDTIQGQMTAGYANATAAVAGFMAQEALTAKYSAMDDAAYVNALFANLNAYNSGEALTEIGGYTAQAYADLLTDGSIDRDTVAWNIAASADAQTVLGDANYVVALNDAASTPEQPVMPEPTPVEPVVTVPADTTDLNGYIANNLPDGATEVQVVVGTPQPEGAEISELPAAVNDVEVQGDTPLNLTGMTQPDFTLTGSTGSSLGFSADAPHTVNVNGANDVAVTTGAQDDSVSLTDVATGNVNTGAGNDALKLDNSTAVTANTGDGNDTADLTGVNTGSVDMGAGFDTVNTGAAVGDYGLTVTDGKLNLTTPEGTKLDIANAELVVATPASGEAGLGDVSIIASDATQDLVGKLFYVAYGKDAVADMQDAIQAQTTAPYASAEDAVTGFMAQNALASKYDAMNDTAYANALFANLNAYNNGEDLTEIGGYTAQEYADLLAAGTIDRDTVAWNIAASPEAQTVLGNYVVAMNDAAATPEQPVIPEPTPVEPVITVPANTTGINSYITDHLPAGATEVKVIVETPQPADEAITELAAAVNEVEVQGDTPLTLTNMTQADFTLTGSTGSSLGFSADAAHAVSVSGATNLKVDTGAQNDSVSLTSVTTATANTGAGNDTVMLNTSKDVTANTGDGADSVTVNGSNNFTIETGSGDDSVSLTGSNQGSINMGAGFDSVAAAGAMSQYTFAVDDNDELTLLVKSAAGTSTPQTGTFVTLDGVELITFDNGADKLPSLDSSSILASDASQDLLGKLFYVAYGKDTIADMKTAIKTQMTTEYADAAAAVAGFMAQDALASKYSGIDDAAYVNDLFANLNAYNSGAALTEIGGYTAQGYTDLLTAGTIDRDTVAWKIAASTEAQSVLGAANYVVALNDAASTPEQPVIPEPTPTEPIVVVPANTTNINGYITDNMPEGFAEVKVIVETPQPASEAITALPMEVNEVEVQGDTPLNITFAANDTRADFTLTGSKDSTLAFLADKNLTVTLNNTNSASLTTNIGNDTVNVNGGAAGSVITSAGDDVVNVSGTISGTMNINTGVGNDTVKFLSDTSVGGADINGDTGFDLVMATGTRADHTFTVESNIFNMSGGSTPATMQNINLVVYSASLTANSTVLSLDEVSVLAFTEDQSTIAKLYQIVFGRSVLDGQDGIGTDPLEGYRFWTTEFQTDSTQHLVYSFLNCDEFRSMSQYRSDLQYANKLFANLNEYAQDVDMEAVTSVNGHTAQEYADMLTNGEITREDMAWKMADSVEAVQMLGINGAKTVIDAQFVLDDEAAAS